MNKEDIEKLTKEIIKRLDIKVTVVPVQSKTVEVNPEKVHLPYEGEQWELAKKAFHKYYPNNGDMGVDMMFDEFYRGWVESYEANQSQVKPTEDAVEFGEWLRTFEALEKLHGFWVLESQISTEKLYKRFKETQSTQPSLPSVEEEIVRIDENTIVNISEFVANKKKNIPDGYTFSIGSEMYNRNIFIKIIEHLRQQNGWSDADMIDFAYRLSDGEIFKNAIADKLIEYKNRTAKV